jgi:hypothetical protein
MWSPGRVRRSIALVSSLLLASATSVRGQVGVTPTLFTVDPRGSFYNASDPGASPTVVNLTGVPTGALLFLFPQGYLEVYGGSPVYYDTRGSQPWGFSALFSSSNTLLPYNTSHTARVPGAVASGLPEFQSFVAPDGRLWDTDIAFDFRVYQPLAVLKPAGASYLFLGIVDDQYWDNRTLAPNMFGVYVAATTDGTIPGDPNPRNLVSPYTGSAVATTTPEPATLGLLVSGLMTMLAFARRRRASIR